MDKEKVINEIYNSLQERTIFKKYNSYYGFNFLEKTNWLKRLHYFSWGVYYLFLCTLSKGNPSKKDHQLAADIELLCISAVLLDDFLDEDSPVNKIISSKHLPLLAFDCLLESIDNLAPESSYKHIKEAMTGEWYDFSYTLTDPLVNEDFYFTQVMKKNIDILKFILEVVDKERLDFRESYAYSQSVVFQLLNDTKAVFLPHKGDLMNLKPSLPLIKTYEVYGEEFLKAATPTLRLELVDKSGAILYCNYIIEEEKENCRHLLKERFNESEQLNEFLNYLRLEE